MWDGNYYALGAMLALGLEEHGGAVRAGFLHYTTLDEVDRLCDLVAAIAAGGSKPRACVTIDALHADVAELVDAHGSGPCVRKDVEVQVLSSALSKPAPLSGLRSFWAVHRSSTGLRSSAPRAFSGSPPRSRMSWRSIVARYRRNGAGARSSAVLKRRASDRRVP